VQVREFRHPLSLLHNSSLTSQNALMSNLISSFIIDPVVRQARRFSGAAPYVDTTDDRLSHANSYAYSLPSPPSPAILENAANFDSSDGEGASQTDDARETPLIPIDPSPRLIRRPQLAVVEDDALLHELETSISTAPEDAPAMEMPAMSSNPSHTLEAQFRQLALDPTTLTPATTQGTSNATPGTPAQNAGTMSESLPADDGMRHLRARIHEIRDLRIAEEDKALMMHNLMMERYNCLRPTSPSSFVSHDRPFTPTSGRSIFSEAHISSPISTASEIDPENPFNLRPGDTNPTYRTRSSQHHISDSNGEDEDYGTEEDGSTFGCQHYKRNVKVQCHQCRRWYTCRHCHDEVEDHNLDRRKTQNMLCMACGTPQSAGEYCTDCGQQAAWYYCHICKLWDDNTSKKIYHCIDCGICRRGAGLGKDYFHCKVRLVSLKVWRQPNIIIEM
jgi:uncharacterized CHY-type Zn-finger protein